MPKEIVIFNDGKLNLEVAITPESDTVWLTQEQMADLFDTARSSIAYHINNIFKENELDKNTSVEIFDRSVGNASRPPQYYNLDVIISVGYRVKSKRGVAFRRWANKILKEYVLRGYAVNDNRLKQLQKSVEIMSRVQDKLASGQVLSIIEQYTTALDMLDDYDHQCVKKPKGEKCAYRLTYKDCKKVIDSMRFGAESNLFGNEKDDSFKGSIGNIYQSFGGKELFSTVEEKAANLLYYIVKNHSFSDGNKRIAAAVFLFFLEKTGKLFRDGNKVISDSALVAIVIITAESRHEEKEIIINLIMNFIK